MSPVKLRRQQAGMSQAELAKRAHMTASKLSKIENGTLKLKVDDLLTFARVLGCKPCELIRELEEEEAPSGP
jgi:transcriptional regulator with XRE-family HTH domain